MSAEIDTKTLVLNALAADAKLCAVGQVGHVALWDARKILYASARQSPDADSPKPNRITLALDDLDAFAGSGDDLLRSVRGEPEDATHAVLLVAIDINLARQIFAATQSRIVRPDQPIVKGNGRIIRP